MRLDLTPQILFEISAISARIPDVIFAGKSRNTNFRFKAGLIYVNGRILRKPNADITRIRGIWAESLILPVYMTLLSEVIRCYNVGTYIDMQADADLEKALAVKAEALTA
jgi:hypothetical protein